MNKDMTQTEDSTKGQEAVVLKINPERRVVRNLIKKISNKKRLLEFLKDNGIADVEQIHEITAYPKSDDRERIIITAKERKLSILTKIFIDLRLQEPSICQVKDALYGIGKDCDIKIIMHSDGEDIGDDYYEYPSADHSIVASLVGELQRRNIPIVLMQISEVSGDVELIPKDQDLNRVNRLTTFGLPSREDFWQYTFWNVYYRCMEAVGLYCGPDIYRDAFADDSIAPGQVLKCRHHEMYIDWENNFINIEIRQTDDSECFFQNYLKTGLTELKRQYGTDNVFFENVIGRLPRLYIKRPCEHISWLFTAHPQEIRALASSLVNEIEDLQLSL